jgi:hypothetical protein
MDEQRKYAILTAARKTERDRKQALPRALEARHQEVVGSDFNVEG